MSAGSISRTVAVLVVLLALALLVTGCGGADDVELTEQEQAVQTLLELRMERSTDASAYAEVLLEPALAQELARASEQEIAEESTITPMPEWQTPYLSSEPTETADVVVVWVEDEAHADWPRATVFLMSVIDGTWRAGDATAIVGTATIPPPLDR